MCPNGPGVCLVIRGVRGRGRQGGKLVKVLKADWTWHALCCLGTMQQASMDTGLHLWEWSRAVGEGPFDCSVFAMLNCRKQRRLCSFAFHEDSRKGLFILHKYVLAHRQNNVPY